MRRRTLIQLAGGAALARSTGALAQSYPTKSLSIVVPYPAGGPTDTLTRIMAEAMQRTLGQSILVENVTGASGAVGVTKVARAQPDGYTLSVGHAGSHITIWAIQPGGGFELLRDMAPVGMFAVNPMFISARRNLEPANLQELLAWLKANPGKATMGGALGTIGHMASLDLRQRTGVTFQFVPYRGGAPAMQDLLSGQIDLLIDQAANSLPQLRGGKIKAYAVTAGERLAAAPEIPAADEAGLPGFHVSVWHAIWVPRATPDAVIDRLNAAIREALASTSVQRRFADLGQDIPKAEMQTVQRLAEFQKAEVERWAPMLKAANLKAD
ncbi:MAG: tripartite tricarboxylate transporter substrate binding protein BugD [Reyranella sp.]|nr:tripartite tricarboxylate transporter substrate binding protein BugD [Reyranella sp.]